MVSRKRKRSQQKRRQRRKKKTQPRKPYTSPSGTRGSSPVEIRLRQWIQGFALSERFAVDFDDAMAQFFGLERANRRVIGPDEEAQLPGFQEWYFFDYPTHEDSACIVDIFATEKWRTLKVAERQMLDDWRATNQLRAFEVLDVQPGIGERVQDLLTGETLEMNDISASRTVLRWAILFARPLLTEGRWHFTGSATVHEPKRKADIVAFLQREWNVYCQAHPDATPDEFYRDRSLAIYHFSRQPLPPPGPPVTAEGHAVVTASAAYRIKNVDKIFERLDQAKEFQYVGPSAQDPNADMFLWLQRGRSCVPESPIEDQGERLMLGGKWMLGPGQPTYKTLGDLLLWSDKMKLECLSRERLVAGKSLLDQVLGRWTHHLEDIFRDIQDAETRQPLPSLSIESEVDPEIDRALQQEMLERHYMTWLDTPIPTLDHQTPRQAVQTPEGRAQVIEALKQLEYHEAQRSRLGKVTFDANRLRDELGLPRI